MGFFTGSSGKPTLASFTRKVITELIFFYNCKTPKFDKLDLKYFISPQFQAKHKIFFDFFKQENKMKNF
jgi:hypothetical protein